MSELVASNEHNALARAFGVVEFGKKLESAMGRESKEVQKVSFAPSSLGYSGSCPRRWYYAFNGANFEYENDPTSIANMESGSDAGKRLADLFDKAGILVEAEKEARLSDPPVFGYIDAVVEWKGEEIPVEVKTTKNETWNYRFVKNAVPGYQLIQLLIYMRIEGKTKGFFVTENKNDHRLFILPVKMTEEYEKLVDDVLDWMRTVKDNADNGELPIRPFTKSSLQCKGCEVKNTCWEGWTRGKVNGTDPNPGVVDLPPLVLPK